ncbi:MAG: VWA domain-containing protein [Planctomycetia bacterium]|nr:MAG: VWA domain-containing protein [Planctomycetia bacterium]
MTPQFRSFATVPVVARAALVAITTTMVGFAGAQTIASTDPSAGAAAAAGRVCTILPQHRVYRPVPSLPQIELVSVDARIEINEQVASTSLEIIVRNSGHAAAETELLLPVPHGATVRRFGYDGAAPEPTAKVLPRDEARRIYEAIVSRMRDPGLLEFAGYNLLRSSVFPVPPGKDQKIWVTYETLLTADGSRVDYVLPRSDSLERSAVIWRISASIRSQTPIATTYSPSHELSTTARGPGMVSVEVPAAKMQPGAFRLAYVRDGSALGASLVTHAEPAGDSGHFLLLAGLPPLPADAARRTVKREVILVLDRSGSMRGEKMEQARNAAIAVLDGMEDGEAFNIVDYSDQVALYAAKPVIRSASTLADARAYLNGLVANGGTDIHSALQAALRQPATEGMLPMVLFLTDGLPTVGNTGELAIRNDAAAANSAKRRIFTFGVGHDVNAALLDQVALATRGSSINVLPGENIETAVSTVFRRLSGPVLAEPRITVLDGAGAATVQRVRDLLPAELPDLFDGDQLVLLGQYRGTTPLRFRLSGTYLGQPRDFEYEFAIKDGGIQHAYVSRLWASRKIAHLLDAIRQFGPADPASSATPDPRTRELVDEIVQLSTRYGILTEYTAFLVTDGESLPRLANGNVDLPAATARVDDNVRERAQQQRTGSAGVAQAINIKAQVAQSCDNKGNRYWSETSGYVENRDVQQLADQCLFRDKRRWVDARIYTDKTAEAATPQRIVEFATPEYFELADKLAGEGRAMLMSLEGEVYLIVEGQRVLIRNPEPQAS